MQVSFVQPAGALTQLDALDLACALVGERLSALHIRGMLIKGLTARIYNLRDEYTPADVDVWLEPTGVASFLEDLARLGWVEREGSVVSDLLVQHSRTVFHADWPCDIDVHSAFPGFLSEPSVTFDECWTRARPLVIAGVSLAIPDRATSILIAALHSLRTPSQTARHGREFAALASDVVPRMTEAELSDLVALSMKTSSVDTARPLLELTGVPLPPPRPYREDPQLDDWRRRTGAGGSVAAQALIAIRKAPRQQRLQFILSLLWPTENEIRKSHPDLAAGGSAVRRFRVHRLGRGIRSLPSVMRARRHARRAHDPSRLERES